MFKLIVFIIFFRLLWTLIIAPIIKGKLFVINNRVKNNNNKYRGQKFYRDHNSNQDNNKQYNKQLTKCNVCDLYLPIEDAVYNNGKPFCCNEHANY